MNIEIWFAYTCLYSYRAQRRLDEPGVSGDAEADLTTLLLARVGL